MLDLEGLQVSDVEKDLLSHPGTGGLILFTRNYQDRQQLAELIRQIRAVRPEILIAVDQEGGAYSVSVTVSCACRRWPHWGVATTRPRSLRWRKPRFSVS